MGNPRFWAPVAPKPLNHNRNTNQPVTYMIQDLHMEITNWLFFFICQQIFIEQSGTCHIFPLKTNAKTVLKILEVRPILIICCLWLVFYKVEKRQLNNFYVIFCYCKMSDIIQIDSISFCQVAH